MRVIAAMVAAIALLLSACGSGEDDAAGSPVASNEPASTSPAETESPSEETTSPAQSPSPEPEPVDPRGLTGPRHVEVTETIPPVAESPEQAYPVEFTDETGQSVTIEDGSRVLLLDIYGTYSQIAVGLGLEDVLVGRTSSDTQPELADLPLVTQEGHNLNAEAIMSLTPTLVVTDTTLGPPEVIEQLRASQITVVELSSERTMDTVDETIQTLSTVLGVPEVGEELAAAALADIDEAQAEIAELAPADPLRLAVLYIRGTAGVFFIFGSGYGTAELIEGVGARDVATEQGIEDIKPANAEALVSLDPEVLLVMTGGLESTGGIDGLLERPGVAQTTAGLTQRIVDVEDGLLLSFGPNTGNVMRAIAQALYAE